MSKFKHLYPPSSDSSHHHLTSFWCGLIFLLLTCLSLHAASSHNEAGHPDRWPQFRGPGSRGVSVAAGLPDRWSTNENVRWSVPIPGYGWSSPVVWDDRIFLTTAINEGETETPKKGLYFGGERKAPPQSAHHWWVYCLHRDDGRVLWRQEVRQGTPVNPLHVKNTYASETPVTDGERVYAYFGNVGLFCFDREGTRLWSKSWPPVKTRYGWGSAASPVLQGDRIYLVNDNEDQSFLVALDKKTGQEAWRVDRDEPSNWATPFVWSNALRTEIVTPGRTKVRSYDLNGQVLWELSGMSTIVIPTPFTAFDLLYVASGYVGDKIRPVYAIRPGARGDISLIDNATTNQFIAWSDKAAAPYNPSPLVYGDYFYVLFDFGFLSCHDARTGRQVYDKQRIDPEGRLAFTASPWAADGKIFCLSEDGDTYVFKAGPEFQLLHKNSLEEMCMATPALAGKSLYLRTAGRLYRIEGKGD